MTRFKQLFWLVIIFAMLTGCTPVYHTTYSYIMPGSSHARQCIAQCKQSKHLCSQMCRMQQDNCRYRHWQGMHYHYGYYHPYHRYYYHPYPCRQGCNCTAQKAFYYKQTNFQ